MWLSSGRQSSTTSTTECTEYADFSKLYKKIKKCVKVSGLSALFELRVCVCVRWICGRRYSFNSTFAWSIRLLGVYDPHDSNTTDAQPVSNSLWPWPLTSVCFRGSSNNHQFHHLSFLNLCFTFLSKMKNILEWIFAEDNLTFFLLPLWIIDWQSSPPSVTLLHSRRLTFQMVSVHVCFIHPKKQQIEQQKNLKMAASQASLLRSVSFYNSSSSSASSSSSRTPS